MRLQPQIEASSNCHCHRPADRSPAGSISGPIYMYWLVPGRSVVPEALARALSSDSTAAPSDRPQQRIAAPGKKSTHLLCNAGSIGSTALGSSLLVLQNGGKNKYNEWLLL